MGRVHKATRWALKPIKNAIALCVQCHQWLDQSKDDTPIFNEESRGFFKPDKNAYAFLVNRCGYAWTDIYNLYALAHRSIKKYGPIEKLEINKQLKEYLSQCKTRK